MLNTYYDIDAILADNQKIPCTFDLEVPGLGYIEGNADSDINKGTRIQLPLWLSEMLYLNEFLTIHVPDAYSSRVRNALKADPKALDVRGLSPYWYALGEKLVNMFEDDGLIDIIINTLRQRTSLITDHSQNQRGGIADSQEFLKGLDESERILFRSGYDMAKRMKTWLEKGKF